MCNNGHGHRQLWTKYVVHIVLHKYSDNGRYRPNSSNNRPTKEPGVTPGPAGGERLLLPVLWDSRSSQSRSQHSRGMKGGRSSRGILPLPCKTLHQITVTYMATWHSSKISCTLYQCASQCRWLQLAIGINPNPDYIQRIYKQECSLFTEVVFLQKN